MVKCALSSCKNTPRKSKTSAKNRSFHNFPVDDVSKKKWINFCKLHPKTDVSNKAIYKICSDHFEDDCFQRDLRAELMNLPRKKCLLFGAIPNVIDSEKKSGKTERDRRIEKKESRKLVNELLQETQQETALNLVGSPDQNNQMENESGAEFNVINVGNPKPSINITTTENQILKEENKKNNVELLSLRSKYQQQQEKLEKTEREKLQLEMEINDMKSQRVIDNKWSIRNLIKRCLCLF